MFNTSQFVGKDLEVLVRIALIHKELSPGVAAAIEQYRTKSGLTAAEQRQLEILDNAMADACVFATPPIQSASCRV